MMFQAPEGVSEYVQADRSCAAFAVLIGADERSNGTVRLTDLKTGDQQDVAATSATDRLLERLGTV